MRVLVVNHADVTGNDVTFDRLTPTPDATDRDGDIVVHRAGRLANVAKLDVCPGVLGLIARVRDEFRPHVWHLHAPNVTMMLAILADRRIRPLVVTHHSDIVRQRVLRHVVRPVETAVYPPCGAALLHQPAVHRRVRNPRTSVPNRWPSPLGLDLTPFRTPSAAARDYSDRLHREFTGPLWLSVGRLIYYKGLSVALDAPHPHPRHAPCDWYRADAGTSGSGGRRS